MSFDLSYRLITGKCGFDLEISLRTSIVLFAGGMREIDLKTLRS